MLNSRNSRVWAGLIAIAVTVVALVLVIDRSGLIPWLTLIVGAALVVKICFKPSEKDLRLSLSVAIVPVVVWAATYYYVILSWETAEVVELVIPTQDGPHTARVWVMDIEGEPHVYYDAPAGAAQALLAGSPVQFVRGDATSTRVPEARDADTLSEAEANTVFAAMTDKYGDLVSVADVFYVMLGRSSDRIAVVAKLVEP